MLRAARRAPGVLRRLGMTRSKTQLRTATSAASEGSSSSGALLALGAGAILGAGGYYWMQQGQVEAKSTNALPLEQRVANLELEAACSRNHAFVFIKPHAVTPAVVELVKKRLAESGVKVTAEGVLDNKTIDENRLIDNHYGAIASKAVTLKPNQLNVPDKGKEGFKKMFGISWEDALAQGKVYNAADACEKLGIDGAGLDEKWSTLNRGKNLIKFGGGFYCGQVGDIFVMNGFYMAMRGKYTDDGASLHYMLVNWAPDSLSWEDFRGKVLGATDPGTAAKGAVRREIYDNWKKLGLPAQPDVGDNGVHASASPFEALAERSNWTGAQVETDPYGRGLLAAGVPASTIAEWFNDPQVPFEGKNQSLFDLLEDLDAAECLMKSQLINGSA